MKDDIKEILDYFRKYATIRENTMISEIEDYITNLQEIEKEHKNCTRKHWQQKCAEHCANEMIYKSKIDKAIEYINTHYLNANEPELLNILQGSDKE